MHRANRSDAPTAVRLSLRRFAAVAASLLLLLGSPALSRADPGSEAHFAGYVFDAGKHHARVVFRVPEVECSAHRSAAMVGMASYRDNDDGIVTAFGVRATCAGGESRFDAVLLEPDGKLHPIEDLSVTAGNVIKLARWYSRFEDRVDQRIVNRTQGWDVTGVIVDLGTVATTTRSGVFSAAGLEDGGISRVMPTGEIVVGRVTLDGTPGHLDPTAERVNLVRGTTIFRSAAFRTDRDRFQITYVAGTG